MLRPLIIIIDAGAYTGRYSVQGDGVATGFVSGNQTFNLPSGEYTVDTGASAAAGSGASYFRFTVDAAGQVSSVINPVTLGGSGAAFGSGNTLQFNNVTVTVEPGSYAGRYFLSSHVPTAFTGAQAVTLLPDLLYSVDTGAFVAGSNFFFTLDAAGQVTSVLNVFTHALSGAAVGAGASLILNNAASSVNPNLYTGRYFLSSDHVNPLTGLQTVILVPDLVYHLDNGSFVGTSDFLFTLDTAGDVTSVVDPTTGGPSGAATGAGNSLTLNNVLVHVDPTTYTGLYGVAGGFSVSGPANLVLIPTLAVAVSAAGAVGYIVPDPTQVTPPSLILTIAGQAHTFLFTIAQAVTVTGVSPNMLVQGSVNQALTVTGTNFAPGASLTVSGGGVTVTSVTVLSATMLSATVDVAATAATGFRDVAVTDPGGLNGTGSGLLTIVSQQDFVAATRALIPAFIASGDIAAPQANNLIASLDNAARQIGVNDTAAIGMLGAVVNKLDAFVKAGKVTPAARDALAAEINALISSLL